MSPAFLAALLVLAAMTGLLILCWMAIDRDVDLSTKPEPEPEPELQAPSSYAGAHAWAEVPPRSRVQWLGGDETTGFWIWAEDPAERAEHLGDFERRRRFRRQ